MGSKLKLKNKAHYLNYFYPDFKLRSIAETIAMNVVGIFFTIIAVIMTVWIIHEGYIEYMDMSSIKIQSSKSFSESSQLVNMVENHYYPVIRLKNYYNEDYFNSTYVERTFKF